MRTRQELHDFLLSVIPAGIKLYHNPPANVRMSFPCIRYELNDRDNRYANNGKYLAMSKYTLTVIDTNPDSGILKVIEQLPYCEFDRQYLKDGLYHWVYSLYY